MSSTLMELLSRDPFDCSRQDIDGIVEYYRGKRQQFVLADLKAGSATRKQSKGEAEAAAVTKNLNIGDML